MVLAFILFAFFVSIYAVGYGFELLSTNLSQALFWSKIQYIGFPLLPGLLLYIILHYTGNEVWVTRTSMGALFFIPALVMGSRFTNELHGWVYADVQMVVSDTFGTLLDITPGPLYELNDIYTHLILLVSTIIIAPFTLNASPIYRRQSLVMMGGCLIHWIAFGAYALGVTPKDLDISPILFSITVPMLAMGIFRFSLFNLVPLAWEMIFDNMADAVLVLDSKQRLVDYNRRCLDIFPQLDKKWIGSQVVNIMSHHNWGQKALALSSGNTLDIIINKNGYSTFYQLSVRELLTQSRQKAGVILTFSDISRHKQLMEKLEAKAGTDELTGIFNRRHLMQTLKTEMIRGQRTDRPLSLMMMDLDHFKSINDTHGHQCGDEVLRHFAGIISENIREIDVFGRYGGEEFLIVLPETDGHTAFTLANRLCALVEKNPWVRSDIAVKYTVSIGLGWMENDASKAKDFNLDTAMTRLLKQADNALYQAKNQGRNRAVKASRSALDNC